MPFILQSPKLFANFAYAYRARATFNCGEKNQIAVELERSDIIVFQLCDFSGNYSIHECVSLLICEMGTLIPILWNLEKN